MFIPTSWLSCPSEGQEAGFYGLGRGGASSSLHCGSPAQVRDRRLGLICWGEGEHLHPYTVALLLK